MLHVLKYYPSQALSFTLEEMRGRKLVTLYFTLGLKQIHMSNSKIANNTNTQGFARQMQGRRKEKNGRRKKKKEQFSNQLPRSRIT